MHNEAGGGTLAYPLNASAIVSRVREQYPLFSMPVWRRRELLAQPLAPTSLPVERQTRKQLGAWYTPPEITHTIARWAVRSPRDRILDPAVGDGDFLLDAAERLSDLGQEAPAPQLFGVDINGDA